MPFSTAPATTVKKKFSESMEATTPGGGSGTEADIEIPSFEQPDLAQQPIPPGVSSDQIAAFFQPLLDQMQNEQQPLSRPVPAQINPTGQFLGLLAGNLASVFSQNPAFARQAQQYMAEQEHQRKAIEEQNYVDQLTFNTERRNKLVAIRGQILEQQLDAAIKAGDQERALVISGNLAKLQEGLKRESDAQAAEQRKALIQIEGQEQRKTEKTRSTIKKEEETKSNEKPLTMRQYLQSVNDTARNKELGGMQPEHEFFGLKWGKENLNPIKTEAIERVHADAVIGGEPAVREAAKRNLKSLVKQRLGLHGKKYPTDPGERDAALKADLERFAAEVGRYGLSPEQLN